MAIPDTNPAAWSTSTHLSVASRPTSDPTMGYTTLNNDPIAARGSPLTRAEANVPDPG